MDEELEETLKRKVIELASILKVKFKILSKLKEYCYNGKNEICVNNTEDSYLNIIHELCHYQVAAPYRRKKPEYGLGDIDYNPKYLTNINRHKPLMINEYNRENEEECAILLVELWMKYWFNTEWDYFYALPNGDNKFIPALENWGLIIANIPQPICRDSRGFKLK